MTSDVWRKTVIENIDFANKTLGRFGIVTSKLQGVDHVHEISFPHHTESENLHVNHLSVVY